MEGIRELTTEEKLEFIEYAKDKIEKFRKYIKEGCPHRDAAKIKDQNGDKIAPFICNRLNFFINERNLFTEETEYISKNEELDKIFPEFSKYRPKQYANIAPALSWLPIESTKRRIEVLNEVKKELENQ